MNKTIISAIKNLDLKDAGVKPKKDDFSTVSVSSSRINYPNLYLNSKNAPDLKGYDAGDDVTILLKGKIVCHDISKGKNHSRESFEIDVHKLTCIK